jgi:hypothetical protein
MSSEIGYGYSAIKAGETRYQQALVDLVKESAQKSDANASTEQSKSAPPQMGKHLDLKA